MSRHFCWALLLAPLVTASAHANSITTFGVIITALGNDLQVQDVDKAGAEAAMSGGPAFSPGSGGTDGGSCSSSLLITPNGSGGILVQPFGGAASASPVTSATPPATGASGNSSSGSGSSGSAGTTTANGSTGRDLTTVTTTVEVPAPPTPQTLPQGASAPPGVANTPEPASLTLLALAGLGGIGYARRRRSCPVIR